MIRKAWISVLAMFVVMVCMLPACTAPKPADLSNLPVIEKLSATPNVIYEGNSSLLEWKITNATKFFIQVGTEDDGILATNFEYVKYVIDSEADADDGSWTSCVILPIDWLNFGTYVKPQRTTTYVMTAMNDEGSATQKCKVTVMPPPPDAGAEIKYFRFIPDKVFEGQEAMLVWDVENAKNVSFDKDPGHLFTATRSETSFPVESKNGVRVVVPKMTDDKFVVNMIADNTKATAQLTIMPANGTAAAAGPVIINDFHATNEPVCVGASPEYYIDIDNAVSAVIIEPEDTTTSVELPSSTLKSTGIYPIGFKGASNGKPSKTTWRFGDQPAGDTWTFPATLKVTGKDGTSVIKTIIVEAGPCQPPVTAAACSGNCDCLTEKEALDRGYTNLCQQEPCSAPGEPQKFCYSRCPEGCSCVTEKEADELGYTISCSDEKCDPTSKEAKNCFSPPLQPCSQRCQCLTQAQAKEYGYTDAQRCQTTPCKQDAQGKDMYCYPKPKTPVVNVTADHSFITAGGNVKVCWEVTGEGITGVLFTAAGGKPTPVDPKGCKTFQPTRQTRYLVTAKNAAGSGQDAVTVGVGQPPPAEQEVVQPPPPAGVVQPPSTGVVSPPPPVCPTINSFTAKCSSTTTTTMTTMSAAFGCTASWSVTGPAGTTVSISGIGNVGMSGSTSVQFGTTYTLTARYGTCTRTATVQPSQ